MQPTVVLCTLVLNEMEHLPYLYLQHRDWPGMLRWVFVESADRIYQKVNPTMVSPQGLSVDGTTDFLRDLAKQDERVVHIPYGVCSHPDPSQGKCEARSQYLREADKVKPDFFIVLDADEFYTKRAQEEYPRYMASAPSSWTGFCCRHRDPWRPPSIRDEDPFRWEVKGGFWDIPLCRGWRWSPGLVYRQNHNTPETPAGKLLDVNLQRWDKRSDKPQFIHMAWTSSPETRRAKHIYYEARGEGRTDFRGWYVESRAAYLSWMPGVPLPHGAIVVPYRGPIPECFRENRCSILPTSI